MERWNFVAVHIAPGDLHASYPAQGSCDQRKHGTVFDKRLALCNKVLREMTHLRPYAPYTFVVRGISRPGGRASLPSAELRGRDARMQKC